MIINYSGKWGQVFKHYSFVDILQSYFAKEAGEPMTVRPEWFKNKVCVIGLTATGTSDMHPNPFETLYPGVGIQAEVFNSVINNSFIGRVSRWGNLLIFMLIGGIVSFMTLKTRPIKGLIGLAMCIFFFTAVSVLIFNIIGVWIDLVYPIFAMILVFLSITLYKYITEWKKRLLFENELDIAKRIQESFLPKSLPEAHGLVLYPAMFTAKQVGGDLYDFVELPRGRLGVMIGDVSGKGVPASLFMAMTTGAFRFFAVEDLPPHEVLKKLNEKLTRESSTNL
ncbi:MAG: CHASE2 domain-containing protein [Candidatus Omnitrophica bacterium]|nr:CHASE2 domain-containing protein [Candidatus Omnitrophota bacterium]